MREYLLYLFKMSEYEVLSRVENTFSFPDMQERGIQYHRVYRSLYIHFLREYPRELKSIFHLQFAMHFLQLERLHFGFVYIFQILLLVIL